MRSKCRTALLALVAALALAAVASASALAVEKPEFSGPTGVSVVGSGGTALFTNTGGTKAAFRSSKVEGKIASKTTLGSVALTFKESGGAEGVCTNAESNQTLKVTGLNARLGWINKAKNEVGLMFVPPTQPLTVCTWEQEKWDLAGEVIAKITPVGTPTSSFTLTFTDNETSKQLPQYFEGEKEGPEIWPLSYGSCEKIEGFEECTHKFNAGIETTMYLSTGSKTEIAP